MQINKDDILFVSELGFNDVANQYLNEEADILKENNQFSEKNVGKLFEKFDYKNVLNSEYAATLVKAMIISAIIEYHDQLRKKLLENGIDIGEMDTETTPLRDGYAMLHRDDE